MREIRPSGSEGGGPARKPGPPTPIGLGSASAKAYARSDGQNTFGVWT